MKHKKKFRHQKIKHNTKSITCHLLLHNSLSPIGILIFHFGSCQLHLMSFSLDMNVRRVDLTAQLIKCKSFYPKWCTYSRVVKVSVSVLDTEITSESWTSVLVSVWVYNNWVLTTSLKYFDKTYLWCSVHWKPVLQFALFQQNTQKSTFKFKLLALEFRDRLSAKTVQ